MATKKHNKKNGRRRNGEGSVSERKDGYFQASLMVNGKRKFEYAPTENEAYDKLEALREKARRGVSLSGGDVTLNELVDSYIERYAKPFVRASTLKNYLGYAENYIKNSIIGKKKGNLLWADDVQDFVNDLVSLGLSGKTVCNIFSLVDAVCAQAVRNRLIMYNPCEGVRLPKKKIKERPLITEEQFSCLLKAADTQTMKVAILVLGLGLRIGELLALQWKDLTEVDGIKVLSISKSLKREYLFDDEAEKKNGTKTKIFVADTKTESSVRMVPVTENVLVELESLMSDHQLTAKFLDVSFADDLFIINTIKNNEFSYMSQDRFRFEFARVVRRAGLPKEVTPHALRRYTSSTLIRHGASPVAVAKLLGHSSSSTTLEYYSRESLKGTFETVKLLEK